MNRKLLTVLFLLILITSISSSVYIHRIVQNDAIIASKDLCKWLSDSSGKIEAPIGAKMKPKLETIKNEYGQKTTCRIQRSRYNESYFETSIFISTENKDILGLRFGLYTKIFSRSASIDYLGYWTPQNGS